MTKQVFKSVAERYPRAAQFYRNSRDLLDRKKPAIKTPWGFELAGHPAMAAGSFEPEETRLVRELLVEVDMLVNVGANVGYYCCHALSLGKPVIAVEPIASNLYYLLRNIQENGWEKQAEVYPVALGAEPNILSIWGGGTGASLVKGWANIPESYVTQVPCLTLDRILCNAIDGKRALIIVDVEGAEYAVLQGALKTLQHEPRPIWMMEIDSTTHHPEGIVVNPVLEATFKMFFERNYVSTTADSRRIHVNAEQVHAVAMGIDELAVHNFVFR